MVTSAVFDHAPAGGPRPLSANVNVDAAVSSHLGLEAEERDDMPGRLFVRAGSGTLIVLYERARATADSTALTFEVGDILGTVSELRSRGVQFEECDFPGLKTVNAIAERDADKPARFKNSEGNILCVHESLAA